MSRYTVGWLREAIDELGEIWLGATDRNAVTVASAEIERAIEVDAAAKGKPLSEGLRIYDAPPLRAVFSVSDFARKVEIARVRRLQASPPILISRRSVLEKDRLFPPRPLVPRGRPSRRAGG